MASRSEIARQDQATEQRRADAIGHMVTVVGLPDHPDAAKAVATALLSGLIEAIEGEADDITELRRKGWQGKAREHQAAALVVKEWRDDLVAYTPPRPLEGPKVSDTTDAQGIPVSARADSPEALEQRLEAAFGPNLVSVRHIRTVLEAPGEQGNPTPFGRLCGATTGSFTHRGGANCEDCIANYDHEHGPYTGPTAFGTAPPEVIAPPIVVTVEPGDEVTLTNGTVTEHVRRDGPVTPAVAAEIRAEVETEKNARLLGLPTIVEPRMPADTVAIVSPEDAAVFKVGDTVTVGGIEFTKISDNPFGTGGNILNPDNEQGVSLVEPTPFSLGNVKASDLFVDIDPFERIRREAVEQFVMPTVVEPPARPTARTRLTAAQVREHGLARQRGAKHRSVSQVTGYADCGTRAALSDLERPAWWNVGGKAFHACAEEINRSAHVEGFGPLPLDTDDARTAHELLWLQHFDEMIAEQQAAAPDHPIDTWRAANKGSEHYDFWRVEGAAMVSRYVVWLQSMLQDGWTIATAPSPAPFSGRVEQLPVIEFETYLDVGLSVPNLSIIDLALVHAPLDQVLIVDLKAGGSAPKDTFQLGVYGWCLLSAGVATHPSQVRGAYYRARKGELTPPWPVLDTHPWPDVVQRYRDMDVMERQGVYMPNVTNFCGGCGVRDLCPAQSS